MNGPGVKATKLPTAAAPISAQNGTIQGRKRKVVCTQVTCRSARHCEEYTFLPQITMCTYAGYCVMTCSREVVIEHCLLCRSPFTSLSCPGPGPSQAPADGEMRMHMSLRPCKQQCSPQPEETSSIAQINDENDAHVAQRAFSACYLKVNASPAGMHAHQNHEESNQFINGCRNA